jgi:glutamyl-tRNA reductase
VTGELLALGASHKTAPLPLREKLALPAGRAARVLGELTEHDGIHEAVALFTCNRTELYLITEDALEGENVALAILSRQAELRPTELIASLYSLRGREAVEHLFSVTAGLDSMIVGEAEIQGQVKRAYEMALVEASAGRSRTASSETRWPPASGRVPRPTSRARTSRSPRSRFSWRPTSWASWPTGECSLSGPARTPS